MRILVYTGKGGVGKTSVAAATAVRCAALGYRTIVIIVDAAPTGETLRLLSFPDVMRWWMQRIFPIQRRAMGLARPLISTFIDIPLPTERVYDSVERLFSQLDTLHTMLIDPKLTSIRLVLNPEKMVISEAQRTSTYFHLFGYPMDL